MQKWGKQNSGSQRYPCSKCGLNGVVQRKDLTQKYRRELYETWLLSKFTLTDFARKYGITRQTLDRWFAPFRDVEIVPSNHFVQSDIFIIDGYYVEYGATVLIAQNPQNRVVGWHFTYAENSRTWFEFFNSISSFPRAIVCDGQRGMLKAIQIRYPGVIIKRCQFHVIHYINLLLTKHPETEAARSLKSLVNRVTQVKSRDDIKTWLLSYKSWYHQYYDFLKEKTYQEKLTLKGRRKWHYTHEQLQASYSHLKNALPNLFQYLRYPEIPNTSNRIEGGINSQIQRRIDYHRGTKLLQRRQIIAALLKQKQNKKTNSKCYLTQLLKSVERKAKVLGCEEVWEALATTHPYSNEENSKYDAFGFYETSGYTCNKSSPIEWQPDATTAIPCYVFRKKLK